MNIEGKWLLLRLGCIGLASVIAWWAVAMQLSSFVKIHPALLNIYVWLVVSVVWLVGLGLIFWQLRAMPGQPQKPLTSWFKDLPGGKLKRKALDPEPRPPQDLKGLVEERLRNALTKDMIDVQLELPENTEIDIAGQKWKVTKGKVILKSSKTQAQSVEDTFGKRAKKRAA